MSNRITPRLQWQLEIHSYDIQTHVGTARRPKLILTRFNPITLTLDLSTLKSNATRGRVNVALCAKFGSASLIFCSHAIFVVKKLSMESFIYLF